MDDRQEDILSVFGPSRLRDNPPCLVNFLRFTAQKIKQNVK
jgi:hypothetical protein